MASGPIARSAANHARLAGTCLLFAGTLGIAGGAQALHSAAPGQTGSTLDTKIELGGFVSLGCATVVSANEIWALSDGGLVLYDGQSWTATDVLDPRSYPIAIDHFGQNVWVATEDCRLGLVVDRRAELVSSPWPCNLYGLVATGDDSVVATGQTDTGRGLLLFYDGGDWRRLVVEGVSRLGPSDLDSDGRLWAGADGGVVTLAGGTAVVHRDLAAGCYIYDLQAVAPDDVWLAGKCGESDSPFEESQPFIARYDGSELLWEHLGVDTNVWWITDVEIVNETLGWATAHGGVIYGYDGTSWSVRAEFRGGIRSALNAVAVIDEDHAFFTASTGEPIEFIDGEFHRFLGRRSSLAPVGDYGLLTSLAVTESGEGWSVGLGGPVMHRHGGSESWVAERDVPHGENLVSVSAASSGDVWFGSYPLRGSGRSEMLHYDGREYTEYLTPTTLPIWGVAAEPDGTAWAVASTKWLATTEEARSEILRWTGSGWTRQGILVGEELVAMDSPDGRTVYAVGSGVFECGLGGCNQVAGFGGCWVKDVMFSSPHHGYAAGYCAAGPSVFEYVDGRWQADPGFNRTNVNDLVYAVWGGPDCAIVTGRDSAWVKTDAGWRSGAIRVATNLGRSTFAFADVAGYAADCGEPFWASGEFTTVARGALGDAGSEPSPSATRVLPTETPTPTPVSYTSMLPLSYR